MLKKIFMFLTIILTTQLFAEEFSIKGIKPGLKFEEISSRYNIKLSSSKSVNYGLQEISYKPTKNEHYYISSKDMENFTIGGSSVFDTGLYFDEKNKLELLEISLYSDSYVNNIKPFKHKFKNIECTTTILENGFGKKFNQENCFLKLKNGVILTEKYKSYNSDRGSIYFISNEKYKEISKLLQINKIKNLNDL